MFDMFSTFTLRVKWWENFVDYSSDPKSFMSGHFRSKNYFPTIFLFCKCHIVVALQQQLVGLSQNIIQTWKSTKYLIRTMCSMTFSVGGGNWSKYQYYQNQDEYHIGLILTVMTLILLFTLNLHNWLFPEIKKNKVSSTVSSTLCLLAMELKFWLCCWHFYVCIFATLLLHYVGLFLKQLWVIRENISLFLYCK